MAFSSVLLERRIDQKGMIAEKHSWDGDSVTTGDITTDTSDSEGLGEITSIEYGNTTNNADNNTAFSVAANVATLTFTSNDTGTVTLHGKAR